MTQYGDPAATLSFLRDVLEGTNGQPQVLDLISTTLGTNKQFSKGPVVATFRSRW